MKNRTIFTNLQLTEIENIQKDVLADKKRLQLLKEGVTQFYLDKAPNRNTSVDLITEAWVDSVVHFLVANGYKITKGE